MSKIIKLPGRVESAEVGGIVTGANAIMDDEKGKVQSQINSETDAELLRLQNEKQDNITVDGAPTEGSNNPVASGGVYTAEKALSDAIEAILLLIPSAATELNKLADREFVASSIATSTATFKGTFNLVSDLHLSADATHEQIAGALDSLSLDADTNDYCFVQVPESDTSEDIKVTQRYKFNGTTWAYEYDLNNSGFTAEQWAAINSNITAALTEKLMGLPTSEVLAGLLAGKQDVLTFDEEPTAGSNNPVTSGGVFQANNEIIALINALDQAKQDVLTFDQSPVQGSSNPVTSGGVYDAIYLVQTVLATLGGNVETLQYSVSLLTEQVGILNTLYQALTQSDIIVGALPGTGVANRVYRVPGTSTYSDWMWYDGAWVKLAEYTTLDGYVYKGVAVPMGGPTGSAVKMFYIAIEPGTYLNFGNLEVERGINILKYDGANWSKDTIIGIDAVPAKNSPNLVTSGAVFDYVTKNGGAYDISVNNPVGGQPAVYETLSDALGADGANVPEDVRKGGMSVKFIQGTVQSSDNKYVQYRLMAQNFTTDVTQWQGVDITPVGGSKNLIESGGVIDYNAQLKTGTHNISVGEIEIGAIQSSNGNNFNATNRARTKDYLKGTHAIVLNDDYCLKVMAEYDSNGFVKSVKFDNITTSYVCESENKVRYSFGRLDDEDITNEELDDIVKCYSDNTWQLPKYTENVFATNIEFGDNGYVSIGNVILFDEVNGYRIIQVDDNFAPTNLNISYGLILNLLDESVSFRQVNVINQYEVLLLRWSGNQRTYIAGVLMSYYLRFLSDSGMTDMKEYVDGHVDEIAGSIQLHNSFETDTSNGNRLVNYKTGAFESSQTSSNYANEITLDGTETRIEYYSNQFDGDYGYAFLDANDNYVLGHKISTVATELKVIPYDVVYDAISKGATKLRLSLYYYSGSDRNYYKIYSLKKNALQDLKDAFDEEKYSVEKTLTVIGEKTTSSVDTSGGNRNVNYKTGAYETSAATTNYANEIELDGDEVKVEYYSAKFAGDFGYAFLRTNGDYVYGAKIDTAASVTKTIGYDVIKTAILNGATKLRLSLYVGSSAPSEFYVYKGVTANIQDIKSKVDDIENHAIFSGFDYIGSPSTYISDMDTTGMNYWGESDIHDVSLTDLYAQFDTLATQYPDWFHRESDIGMDESNTYPIRYYTLRMQHPLVTDDRAGENTNKWSDSTFKPRRILINLGTHCNEPRALLAGFLSIKEILESDDDWAWFIKNNLILDIIPCLSPWSVANGWVGVNANDININRTFFENQQSENIAFINLVGQLIPRGLVGMVDYHNTGLGDGYLVTKKSYWAYNYYVRLAQRIQALTYNVCNAIFTSDRSNHFHAWDSEGNEATGQAHQYINSLGLLGATIEIAWRPDNFVSGDTYKGVLLEKSIGINLITAFAMYRYGVNHV